MDGLRWYLNRIGQFPPLPDKELRQLIRQAQQGNKEAREKVIAHNLRLVVHAVKPYQSFLPLEDLIQEGNMILITAILHYNPRKGKLSTYATKCIQKAILRTLHQEDTIRVPDHMQQLMLKFYRKVRDLSQQKGREVPQEEVMERLVLPDSQKKLLEQALSLRKQSHQIFDLDQQEWVERELPDERPVEEITQSLNYYFNKAKVEYLLRYFNTQELAVLTYRFGVGLFRYSHTRQETSEHLQLSVSRIAKVEQLGLRKLRYWLIQNRMREEDSYDFKRAYAQFPQTVDRFLSN